MNMNKNKNKNKNKKVKMRGFMCQLPASTAVACMSDDMRSVIVPGKANGKSRVVDQHGRIGRSNMKYSRLVDSNDNNLLKGNKGVRGDQQLPVSHQQQKKQRSLQLSSSDIFQVVVLKVSLHCQGCAAKVKKHISRMEGVTSFSIDLETKSVTVRGHLSPTRVLESVSKIKRAEFWTY